MDVDGLLEELRSEGVSFTQVLSLIALPIQKYIEVLSLLALLIQRYKY